MKRMIGRSLTALFLCCLVQRYKTEENCRYILSPVPHSYIYEKVHIR